MYAAKYKEMKDNLQRSSMESGQQIVSQAEQNKRRNKDTLKMSAAPRNRRVHLQITKTHGQWQGITYLCLSGIYL
jgi:hypothetical protein